MLGRPMIHCGEVNPRPALPGDIVAGGESLLAGAISTVGAGTLTGAAIATGIINRTGPGAGYTDTTDSAQNIITAFAGNMPAADVVPGTSIRLLFINTVAFAMTFAAGEGVVAGTGTLNCAASVGREYLVTVLNSTPRVSLMCGTTNGNKIVTFNNAQAMGVVTPGMVMSGTGITAGTKVVGITLNGSGQISGVSTDTNSTATNAAMALVFSPCVQFDALGGRTL